MPFCSFPRFFPACGVFSDGDGTNGVSARQSDHFDRLQTEAVGVDLKGLIENTARSDLEVARIVGYEILFL